MPSVREIRRRIRSVENTAKVTKAMSMVAASKMRHAQEAALESRPYSERMFKLLANLSAQPNEEEQAHPLLRRRDEKNLSIILITPDRGLTGGLNIAINRLAGQFISEKDTNASIVAVGKKGRDFLIRTGQNIEAVFTDIGDRPSLSDISPISRIVIDSYTDETVDAVYLVYADFVNTTAQTPVAVPLLPVAPATLDRRDEVGYIYEPNSYKVLSSLLPRFVDMQIYHALLESIASEQSARMVAMKNATDNAIEMVEDLTLDMNKARQESITTELLDIVSGAAAVEG